MKIQKALIIADPWIGYILDGIKTWEMRATAASHRGWFGLIRKGTGAIHGVARLVGTKAPLSPEQMIETFEHHRIPAEMIRSGQVAKWNTPWLLADVRRLSPPIPYRHRSGAVTWVDLDDDVSEAIAAQMVDGCTTVMAATEVQPMPAPATPNAGTGVLIGQVEITQGNLDNSHLYLRSFFDRFPDDAIGGSNRHQKAAREITVDWGGTAPVRTDLDGSKRFFRARGWIREFFEMNGGQAGDVVMVEETGPYTYSVRLKKQDKAA